MNNTKRIGGEWRDIACIRRGLLACHSKCSGRCICGRDTIHEDIERPSDVWEICDVSVERKMCISGSEPIAEPFRDTSLGQSNGASSAAQNINLRSPGRCSSGPIIYSPLPDSVLSIPIPRAGETPFRADSTLRSAR
jgi:hypothetical protein